MKRVETLNQLFAHWKQKTDKLAALNRLRSFYNKRRTIINAPYDAELAKHKRKHGANSVTPEILSSLYNKVRGKMTELREWYGSMTKKINDRFDSKDRRR